MTGAFVLLSYIWRVEFIYGKNQSIGSKAAEAQSRKKRRSGIAGLSTTQRRVYPRVYHYPEETEFCTAQSVSGKAY